VSPVADSGEAVNGVAFSNDAMAVSTRAEVVFFRNRPGSDGQKSDRAVYSGGAHGVVSIPSGQFIAPLGPKGLLLMALEPGGFQPIKTFGPKGKGFNFYKLAFSGTTDGRDVVLCALRRGGWATYTRDGRSGSFSVSSRTDLDVVDVCPIRSDRFPFAAVALGIDRSLHFIENVTAPGRVTSLYLGDLRGTAYRVFSHGELIILLTSEALYHMTDLAGLCLGGGRVDKPMSVWGIDLHAVDASIARDRCLLVVRPDGGVTEVAIDDLAGADGRTSSINPVVRSDYLPPTPFELADAVAV
jgi:hypothetical protein